jgi:hypothetical protein
MQWRQKTKSSKKQSNRGRTQLMVVRNGTGAGEEKAGSGAVGLIERDGVEVVEPVEDLAADPLVIPVVTPVIKELHRGSPLHVRDRPGSAKVGQDGLLAPETVTVPAKLVAVKHP